MAAAFSIFLGISIVLLSFFLLKKEIKIGNDKFSEKYPGISDANTRKILDQFEKMETLVNDLNESYYSLVSDLEGKYSIHDKEISLIEEKIDKIQKEFKDTNNSFKYELKEVKTGIVKPDISPKSDMFKNEDIQTPTIIKNDDSNEKPEIRQSRKIDLLNLNDNERDKIRRIIIELRQKGFNLAQIAKHLNVGVGELQLFLNINRIK